MHSLIKHVTPVAVFVKFCSDSLTSLLTSLIEAREWGEKLIAALMLLSVTYLILWPYVVIGVSQWGFLHPLSWIVTVQLLPPTVWAGFYIADGLEILLE